MRSSSWGAVPPNPNNAENQNFEKLKNLHNKKYNKMMYAYSDIECNRHFFAILGHFFALLPHYWPQKSKFGKNIKKAWRYHLFTDIHHKSGSYDV